MDKLARLRAVIASLPGDTPKERVAACAALSGRSTSTIYKWLQSDETTKKPEHQQKIPDLMLKHLESMK